MIEYVRLSNDVTLEYEERGSRTGLPVVFLHGVTDSWRSFEGVLAHLPPWIRAIAVSQRGHGGSSRPDGGYRFRDFAADLPLLFDALEIPAAVVVGHSMGSYVAQRFAIDCPGRVLGLIITGAFPTMRSNVVMRELWESAVATLTDPVNLALAWEFQEGTTARPLAAGALATYVAESLRVPARVWRAAIADHLEADFSPELPAIGAPTLIIWGDRDALCPYSDQVALRGLIPQSQLVVYPGAGHAVHWEDPLLFAADVVAFATEVSVSAAVPIAS